jgi:hypothetical protein
MSNVNRLAIIVASCRFPFVEQLTGLSVIWILGWLFLGFEARANGDHVEAAEKAWADRVASRINVSVEFKDRGERNKVFVTPHGELSERELAKKNQVERTVRNSSYAFNVRLSDGRYFLSGVRRPDQKKVGFENLLSANVEIAFPDLYPVGCPIKEFFNPDWFEKLSEVTEGDLLVLTFRCKNAAHDYLKVEGVYTLRLDPSNGYIPREASLKHPTRNDTYRIDYQHDPNRGMVPSKLRIISRYEGRPEDVQEYIIASPQPAIITPEEFRLPYYGIPESSIGIHPKRLSLKVMVAIGCLVAIAVASYIWYRRRDNR